MKDYEILDSLKDTRVVLELHKETYGDITVPPNVTAVIEELIEKYTPRVPKGKSSHKYCPNCESRIRGRDGDFGSRWATIRNTNDKVCNVKYRTTKDIRCQKCGQIIEWD